MMAKGTTKECNDVDMSYKKILTMGKTKSQGGDDKCRSPEPPKRKTRVEGAKGCGNE